MVVWDDFISVLGKHEHSTEFISFCLKIGENPHISSDPEEYNDPIGKTKYYAFYKSGFEIGFRENLLSHVHFYFYEEDGYSPFVGSLISSVKGGTSRGDIIQLLGKPSISGEGKVDMLIGYINAWLKYKNKVYSLHLQFNEDDNLCRATLMRQ